MMAMEDRYEILDVVARGAMATVWRARDVRLDRVVAIKRPHSADASAAFTKAARSAAGVTHPNLITVFDAGTDETGPYLVMGFVDGPTLAEMGGAPDGVAALGSEIAWGLSALHAEGIVHGDVRPSNILLGPTGSKLTGFATAPGAASGSGVAARSFEAPEVLAGESPTEAADVYALGAVLSWLADQTGRDPELSSIIKPAMAEDPTVRPTAATLAEQLSRIASVSVPVVTTALQDATPADNDETRVFETAPVPSEVPEQEAEPPRPRRGRRVAAVLGVMLLLLLVAVATLPGDDDDPVAADTTSVATTTADVAPTSNTAESPATDTSEDEEEESGGVFNTVRIFVTFIRETPRTVLTNSGAEDIISDVADGVSEAIRGNAEEAQSNLSDAAETVQEEIESESVVDRAIELITRLASQLGLDVEQVLPPSE